MSEGTEIIEGGTTEEQLSDAESIMEELEDKYDDPQAAISVLVVCLAAMMEATGTLQLSWAADDGCEINVQCSPGRDEETLH